jgi:hypothetical protein
MIVSIHQPNYIPWLGFFNKILLSDIYIIFDDIQYPRGKDYANRNQIKTNNSKLWLTLPIIGKSELRLWNKIELNNNGWQQKHLSTIKTFYKKAPYFKNYYSQLEEIYLKNHNKLVDFNVDLIKFFLKALDKDIKILYSSDIKTDLKGIDKIFYILKYVQATKYISGSGEGSRKYIKKEDFDKNNIELIWQEYKHPTYKQLYEDFIPQLSIIDLLFNEGPNSKNII